MRGPLRFSKVPFAALRLLLVTALFLPTPAHARQVEREVQIPVDASRGVVEIDPRLRTELGLFPEIAGFISARLFRIDMGGYVLEITHDALGVVTRERRRLGDSDLAVFRADLQTRLTALGRERVVDRSGRAGFIVGQAAVAVGYHGWAIPSALGVESSRGQVASYLLIGASGFVGPWIITNNKAVSVGQRDAGFWGATRGIVYGLVLGALVAPEESTDPRVFDNTAHRVRVGTGSVVSLLGTVAGYNAARLANHDPGTVALWSAAGDFGLGVAFATSYVLGLYDDPVRECTDFCPETDYSAMRDGHAVTLGLGLASLYGAKRWGDIEDYTVGDARALRSFGLLGAQALLGPAVYFFEDDQSNEGRKIAAMALAGTGVGLALGNRALRRTSLTGGEGLLVLTGHVAGGLAALGVTYLLDKDGDADAEVYLTTSALGSILGSLATFNAVKGGSSVTEESNRDSRESSRRAQLSFHPQAALLPILELTRSGPASLRPTSAPLLTLRFE